MRVQLAVALAILFGVVPTPGRSETPKPPEQEILDLEAAWNRAHLDGDVEALDRLWSDDITVIVPGMQPFTKRDLLEMWRSMKVTFTRYETSDLDVHVDGETAVVTGRLRRSRDFGGRVRDEDWLFTKTYARLDGAWKVVAYHASTAPEP
jgi:uncharacterized protein (TIGR02246 family)